MTIHNDNSASEAKASKRRRRRWWLFALVLVALIGITVYALQQRSVDVRGALRLMRSASEEAATTAAVKTAFALSQKVSAFDIDVDTQGGVVRLSGEVPSKDIRELAVAIAEDTAGVERVVDGLQIKPGVRPSPEVEQLRNRIADLEIETTVTNALMRHPKLADESIRASVEERVVTLEGTVDEPSEKYGAEQIASAVDRVSRVVNSIEVEGSTEEPVADEEPSDETLGKRVRFELFATDAFDLDRVDVRVNQGEVTLAGEVRSQAEWLLAEKIAAQVEGVDGVVNELEVLGVARQAQEETAPEK